MRFKIRKLRFWFDKKFGWFFINGRKQTFWCAQLRSEEKEIVRIEAEIKSKPNNE
jgi:hypothetical protein